MLCFISWQYYGLLYDIFMQTLPSIDKGCLLVWDHSHPAQLYDHHCNHYNYPHNTTLFLTRRDIINNLMVSRHALDSRYRGVMNQWTSLSSCSWSNIRSLVWQMRHVLHHWIQSGGARQFMMLIISSPVFQRLGQLFYLTLLHLLLSDRGGSCGS